MKPKKEAWLHNDNCPFEPAIQTETYVPSRVRREEIAALNVLWIVSAVAGLILFVAVLVP
jgi:hypothetical protein